MLIHRSSAVAPFLEGQERQTRWFTSMKKPQLRPLMVAKRNLGGGGGMSSLGGGGGGLGWFVQRAPAPPVKFSNDTEGL
ncbi:hypothetical protein Bca4012_057827 [Brassica carinata]